MQDARTRSIAVTGAASGLGRAIVARLRRSGATATGIDLREGDIAADLGSASGRRDAVDAILERCDRRLDAVVTAAGVGPYREPELVTAVNYFGTVDLLDALFPFLQRGSDPAALAVSSIGAFFGANVSRELVAACLSGDEAGALEVSRSCTGSQAYVSVKRALVVAVRSRAVTWGQAGTRLNVLVPGNMSTPMLEGVYAAPGLGEQTRQLPIPLGRDGEADEVASTAAFLVGKESPYLHGAMIPVDGGVLAALRPDPFEG